MSFWRELKRRNAFRVGVAYLAGVWLLLQVADIVIPILHAPEWILRILFYVALLGFPVAIVLAWFYELTPEGIKSDSEAGPGKPARFMDRKLDFVIIGVLVLAVGFLIIDNGRFTGRESQPTASIDDVNVDPNSVAVLPFFNIGDQDDGRIFGEGLAEDVINRLATIPGLLVSARRDSFTLTSEATSEDVRRRLRVAYYVEGSIRLFGDTMRVVVQLIESQSGRQVFSRSFDGPRTEFFSFQEEVANLVVASLRVAMPRLTDTTIRPVFDATDNLDVYLSYRRGMDILRQPRTEQTTALALDAFGQALRADPGFAAAHAGICMAYVTRYRDRRSEENIAAAEGACAAALEHNANFEVVQIALGELFLASGHYDDAEAALQEALRLDERSVDALIRLGEVYESQQRLDEAENVLKRAIELQPGNWNAYYQLGALLFASGRYVDATGVMREALSMDSDDPVGWRGLGVALLLSGDIAEAEPALLRSLDIQEHPAAYNNLGLLYEYRDDFPRAISMFEKATEMNPEYYLAWSNLGEALSISNKPEASRQAYEAAERLAEGRLGVNSRDPDVLMDLATIRSSLGQFDSARALIERAAELSPDNPYVHYIDAVIEIKLGNRDAAIAKLETAIETGHPVALLAVDPSVRSLRTHPGFEALVSAASD